MNKIKHIGIIVAIMMMVSTFAGCKSTPYKVAATTTISVQTAMSLWGAYVSANHPPVEQEQAVKTAYEKWQLSMAIVCDAGKTYAAAQQAGASNQSVLLAALEQSITDLDVNKTDLVNLLVSFGVKIS